MPIRAILFDLFDTLVDLPMSGLPQVQVGERSFPSTAGALHEEVVRRRPLGIEEFWEALMAGDRELRAPRYEAGRELATLERFEDLTRRLGIADADLPEQLTAIHMRLLRGQVGALPHHPEVLAELRERYRLACCSNFSHSQTALQVIEEAGLRWHLDAVVVSDAVGFRKPRPEIFQAALAALGVAPEETLHVGDNLAADVAGAAPLGIRTAWLTRCIAEPEAKLAEHKGPKPDLVIGDLAELPDLLGSD